MTSDEQNIFIVNSRLPDFNMDRAYYAGGWQKPRRDPPVLSYLELQFTSYNVCKEYIKGTYKKNLHNLACAFSKRGFFIKVIMSTIFHFSIFNIDRVCWNKKAILFKIEVGTGLFLDDNKLVGIAVKVGLSQYEYSIFALLYNDKKFIFGFVNEPPKPCE